MHEIEKYKLEIADLKKQLTIYQRKDAASQLTERSSNTQVKAIADMNAELNHLLAQAKVELLEAREKKTIFEKENTRLNIQLREAQISCQKTRDHVESLQEQLKFVKDDTQLQLVSMQKQFEDVTEQIVLSLRDNTLRFKDLKQAQRGLELELTQREDRISTLQQDADRLQEFLAQRDAQIAQQTAIQESQNGLLQTLRHQLTQQEKELSEQRDALGLSSQEKSALEAEAERLRALLAQQQADAVQLRESVQHRDSGLGELQRRLSAEQQRSGDLGQQLQRLQAALVERQAEAEAFLRAQAERADRQFTAQSGEISRLQKELSESLLRLSAAEEAGKQAGIFRSALESSLNTAEQRAAELTSQVASLQAQLEGVQAAASELPHAKARAQMAEEQSAGLLREQKQLFDRALRLERELQEAGEALQEKKEREGMLERREQQAEQEKELRKTQEELAALQRQHGEAQKRLDRERAEKAKLQDALVKADQYGIELRERIAQLEKEASERHTAPADDAELERLKAQLQKLQQTVLHECKERSQLMRIIAELRAKQK